MKIVYKSGHAEIIEKKSRFIASIIPVNTEEEALSAIADIKKEHWNASHNCSAFIVGNGPEIVRSSDDGEPGGTAGRPMLDVLQGEDIHNAVAVVTRYFGGTLLGTGGLVRAYQNAVKEGLKAGVVLEKKMGTLLTLRTDYQGLGKLQYLMAQQAVPIVSSDYTEIVELKVLIPDEILDKMMEEIIEATSAKAKLLQRTPVYYAKHQNEIIFL